MTLTDFIKQCHDNLFVNSNQEALVAREYLKSRNVLDSVIESVRMGYCDSQWNIPDSIRFFGAELRKEETPWDMSYYISGRIIVPVYSEFNKVVGFATRKPSKEKGNTWWNLPSPFKKGGHLFLLNLAKKSIFEKNKVYLVEGYMDAIVLRQYGLDNVVSLMGTALTSRKIGLISRYCNNVCLCFDCDENEAGQKANDVAVAILKKFDLCETISSIHLPVGQDPDEYVVKNGIEKFLEQEVTLKDSEIEKICRDAISRKNVKEIIYAQ